MLGDGLPTTRRFAMNDEALSRSASWTTGSSRFQWCAISPIMPFVSELGLGRALGRRPKGTPALDALRNFMVESLSRFDAQARLRWQVVSHDEDLRSRERARQAELGNAIAAAIADELDEDADDLRPQLVTAAVIAAFTATYEHRFSARSKTASRAQAIAVIDEAIAFLRGGLDAIRAFPKPY
jgi:hypothetical protein